MAFDLSTAKPREPVEAAEQQSDTGPLQALAQVAQRVNMSIPQLLDMPSHLANYALDKAGIDFQMPAEMVNLAKKGMESLAGQELPEDYMVPGVARDTANFAGDVLSLGGALKAVNRAPGVASLAADIAGFGSTAPAAVAKSIAPSIPQVSDVVPQLPDVVNPSARGANKAAANRAVMEGVGDAAGAGRKFDPKTMTVVKDPAAKSAINQGFEPGLVAMIKESPKAARENMLKMLDIVKRSKENMRESITARPANVVGDSVMNRVNVVRSANRQAGERLEGVANQLKGQPLDASAARENFLDTLEKLSIKFDENTGNLNFKESDIAGLTGPQRVIKQAVEMLRGKKPGDPLDAYRAHQVKRYIDEQVSYGNVGRGLKGRSERALKDLRRDLDSALDSAFPEYDAVNTQYSETIQALDDFQKAVGRVDLSGGSADSAVGQALRKILTNYGSRQDLLNALPEVDRIAQKYTTPAGTSVVPYKGTKQIGKPYQVLIDDDVLAQVKFVNEIERMFGTNATGSLQGVMNTAVERGVESMTGGIPGFVDEAAKSGVSAVLRKMRGQNEEAAIKSLEDLLRGGPEKLLKD